MALTILVLDEKPTLETLLQQTFQEHIYQQELAIFRASDSATPPHYLPPQTPIDIVLYYHTTNGVVPDYAPPTIPYAVHAFYIAIVPPDYPAASLRTMLDQGVFDFLVSPLNSDNLQTMINNARRCLECQHEIYQLHTIIEENQRIQHAIQTSEEKYRLLFSHERDAIALVDIQTGHLLDVNPAWETLYGYRREEALSLHAADVSAHPETVAPALQCTVEQGYVYYPLRWHRKKDGTIFPVELSGASFIWNNRTVAYAIVRDQTERRHQEDELRTLYRAVEQSPTCIVITDTQATIEYVNPKFTQLTGYTAEEVRGLTPRFLKSSDTPHEVYVDLWQTITAGQVWRGEFHNVKKNGESYWEMASISPIFNEEGQIAHYVAVKEDITERRRIEAALREERALLAQRVEERTAQLSAANAELCRAARLKDEFLASMSHELRTPLNAIIGLTDVLQSQLYTTISQEQRDQLHMIKQSGQRLLTLINDILDLSKIEAGKLTLTVLPCSIERLCQASIAAVYEEACTKDITISLTIEQNAPPIQADERHVRQILVNLLTNAIKFTPNGGAVGLEVHGSPTNEILRFIVWDTGIGIASEDMPRLFKPFVQLDSGLARQYPGTGLGLALVYRLTDKHGGSVAPESGPRGSRFTIALPWSQLPPPPNPHPATIPPGYSRHEQSTLPPLLLADDNEITIYPMSTYLGQLGYPFVIARTGVEAIERAHEVHPALIIINTRMPGTDTLETIGRIRSDHALARTPIVAITSLAMPGDYERYIAAGANCYRCKPINKVQLEEIVQKYL